ncbi:polysaccharide pyruvyl transferase family protein [Polaribacter atrinae]|uniref:Polysaccharide pyruvyl transferase domain-containing protein n=1 Tax=Polaribacter atrinae TaxID=1333662 RepID=A0A176TEE6_9FLAO|nr:polysaccharide pyruvyl transferase family protein [Polaribacter atrinae]OAD46139.1 hypothetical protein LPB303_04280 [Polaribacter atrinae]
MKVLFINDTRIEINPGCHATVTELSKFIKKNLKDADLDFLPLGTGYDVFNKEMFHVSFKTRIKRKIIKKINTIGFNIVLRNEKKIFNIRLWEELALNNFSKEIKDKILLSDLVVINMEGTIHHNSRGGLTLLGFAHLAKSFGKKVAMVNGSYQCVDKKLTKKVLNNIDFLSVREVRSYNYLKKTIKDCSLIPDFAFRANINEKLTFINQFKINKSKQKKCLYTFGVLGVYPNQKNGIKINQITKHIDDIRFLGFEPYFLKIEEKENEIEKILVSMKVKSISYSDGIRYNNIGSLIKEFDLMITGRYHIGIFGLMSNVPTFFLPSNTYKTQGMLEMLNVNNKMIFNNDILSIENEINSFNRITIKHLKDDYFIDFKLFLNRIN